MNRVSVLMSVYKNENSINLEKCLKSIWTFQNHKPDEIIIIKDGPLSSDLTKTINKWKIELESKLIIVENEENIGLTKSLNKGLDYITGKYVVRMDSDDISQPQRIMKQLAFLESNSEIDVVGSFAKNIDDNDRVISFRKVPEDNDSIKRMLPIFNPIIHPSVMIRCKVLKQFRYNEKYRTSQDYALWFNLASAGLKFHNINEDLLLYRMGENYTDKKSFRYRYNEMNIKWRENTISSLPKKIIGILITLVLILAPKSVFNLLKKIDPR